MNNENSKSKHTPGPWNWEDSGLWSRWDFVYTTKEIPEFEANARLIAAAPDLLEALKAIYNAAPCEKPANAELWEAMQLTRAAIALAEGEG